jgi:hypothetical protein
VDDVEDGLLDGVVEPIDDAMIDLAPLRRTLRQWRRGTDVVGNPELAKNGLKETAPLAVIGVVELNEDGDMRTDVHRLENGSRNRLRGIEFLVGIRRVSRGGHGTR